MSEEVYVAVCHDPHIDPIIKVFKEQDDAVDFCRNFRDRCMMEHSWMGEWEEYPTKGWIYYFVDDTGEYNHHVETTEIS